ncbi:MULTISPECIES: maleylpyruvate isomerase family mycothiol-dependent enzyme [unclassified Micromonospora]|uniref:maleylpyruvate isomerase family mycothiol-dependent enzyme n=1 Tax=unclassified Micromonospora TaxID=2617518 RepID=UPI0033B39C49
MSIRDWMDQGTRLFLSAVDGLSDDQFNGLTALPGWTRAHVVAHVHFNAEALRRLTRWARTGEEVRMYADPVQRADEIEGGALLPPAQLRELVHTSALALAADLDSLSHSSWSNEVVTAQGRTVPATEIPWMRTREVTVHAVDLRAGVGFADLPDDLNAMLAIDVVKKRSSSGEAAVLAEWLTGRTAASPTLGPWL